ncbi:MAG: HlyD family efflux transporter periplasmic adaptor subunit [Gammaproteobacteria bacterium]|nr:HlyD family efflux transporter periplasmic adaptor subunit [Gammaproteobacteria bacterium]
MGNTAEKTVPHFPVSSPPINSKKSKKQHAKSRLSIARLIRITISIIVIALALWAFLPGLIYPVSRNAVVNAQVMTIRAPIQGEIISLLSTAGQITSKGELIARIEDNRIDRSKQAAMLAEQATLLEKMRALEKEVAELNNFQGRLKNNAKAYQSLVNKHYVALLAETDTKLTAIRAIASETKAKLGRQSILFSKGLTTQAAFDAIQREDRVARAELKEVERVIERLGVERESAMRGVYIGDGFNNVPYSQQRGDEIDLLLQVVQSNLRDADIRLREVGRQIDVEQERLASNSGADLIAPDDGHIWLDLVSVGEYVTAGTPLMQIAKVSHLFLIVTLNERHFETISIGDPATIDFIGSQGKLDGTVERIQGSKSKLPESRLAVASPPIKSNEFFVFVRLDNNKLNSDANNYNQVGRQAKVTFY